MKKIYSIFIVIIIVLVYLIYNSTYVKLSRLSYSKKTIQEMNKTGISNYVSNNKYSKILDQAILTGNFDLDNYKEYYNYEYKTDEDFIKNLNDLLSIGYTRKTIDFLFASSSSEKIKEIISKGFISDLDKYIEYNYFNIDYLDRYLSYKTLHNYSYEDTITRVNIGLDKDFYINYKEVDGNNSDILVNKYNKLKSDFIPRGLEKIKDECSNTISGDKYLVSIARVAFEKLCTDSSLVNLYIVAASSYRSYSYQTGLYNYYKENYSTEEIDKFAARPGFSEHQTGLALDIMKKDMLYTDFYSTKEYIWLKDNAHIYGFIIRYEEEKKDITGYISEPWHIRYVGEDIATYIYEHKITFDEYYVRFID